MTGVGPHCLAPIPVKCLVLSRAQIQYLSHLPKVSGGISGDLLAGLSLAGSHLPSICLALS